ncbi:MAG: LPS export ABC transporter periplasmic protein LptC [Cyanobacteria bacterium J06553_1]
MNHFRWSRLGVIAVIVLVLVLVLRTCGASRELASLDSGEKIDAELTLQAVTLEQPDEAGNLLWRLEAESVNYTPDNQRAELLNLDGEFFQAGEVIYTVTADEGEVQQNGETLYLRGSLVATAKEGDLTLEGEKLKWQPKQDLLVMGAFEGGDFELVDEEALVENEAAAVDEGAASRAAVRSVDDLLAATETTAKKWEVANAEQIIAEQASAENVPVKGFNPQFEAIAQIISVSNKKNQVSLQGGVLAKSKETPWLTFESDSLSWFTQREVIEANNPLKVEQYAGEDYAALTDRMVGGVGKAQLDQSIVSLSQSVRLDALTQPLTVVSESAVWDVTAETVALDNPVDIEQPEQKITASANQATLDLAEDLVVLTGEVRAVGEKNDARLAADRVQWQTSSQDVEATGNVLYEQAADPEISMAGSQAVGNLERGTVVVTGGESGDVVTEFVPTDF